MKQHFHTVITAIPTRLPPMDGRRASRASAADPKVRRIGFFAPQSEPDPTPPPPNFVSVPPLRHLSAAVPVPDTGIRRQLSGDLVPIGSYNPAESLLGTSPAASSLSSSIFESIPNTLKENLGRAADNEGNNILHLAAHLPVEFEELSSFRASIQMQRELEWFKVN